MIKKRKNLFIYLILSIIFIINMASGCVFSYYNPSSEQFIKDSASDILRKRIIPCRRYVPMGFTLQKRTISLLLS